LPEQVPIPVPQVLQWAFLDDGGNSSRREAGVFEERAAEPASLDDRVCDFAISEGEVPMVTAWVHLIGVEKPDYGEAEGERHKHHAPFAIETSCESRRGNCWRRQNSHVLGTVYDDEPASVKSKLWLEVRKILTKPS
jgi:hypothetical protein